MATLLVYVESARAQCEDSQSVSIVDLDTKRLHLIIENALNDDLANPDQGLCGIRLQFEHGFVGDVRMVLNSPGGDSVILVGPVGEFGQTEFTSWDILFLPCSAPVSPDPGFDNAWSNSQEWGLFGNFGGSYFPETGCLEDFDSGPVNGIWTLTVEDGLMFNAGEVISFSLIFCDESGLDCQQCNADGGLLNVADTLSFCASDPGLWLDLNPYADTIPPDSLKYDYLYTYALNDTIRGITTDLDFRNFITGEYWICGISYLNDSIFDPDEFFVGLSNQEMNFEVNRPNPAHCVARSDKCFLLQISTPPTIDIPDMDFENCLDSMILAPLVDPSQSDLRWVAPDSSEFFGDSLKMPVFPGEWMIFASNKGCRDSTSFIVTLRGAIPQAGIIPADTLRCDNPEVDLVLQTNIPGANVRWSGPDGFQDDSVQIKVSIPGGYTATLEFYEGCIGEVRTEVESVQVFPVYEIYADSASCAQPFVKAKVATEEMGLAYSWTGPGDFSSQDSSVVFNMPGVYTVQVTNSPGCILLDSVEAVFEQVFPSIDSLLIDTLNCDSPDIIIGAYSSDDDISFLWTGPSGYQSMMAFPTVSQAGEYQLSVLSSEGCSTDTIIQVLRNEDFPELIPRNDTLTCLKNEVALIVEADSEFAIIDWTGPGGFSSSEFSPTVNQNGIYTIEITTPAGCRAIADVLIEVDTIKPKISLQDGNLPCHDEAYYIPASSEDENIAVQWTGPDNFFDTTLSPLIETPGKYTIQASLKNGCTIVDSISISADPVYPDYQIYSEGISCANISGLIQISMVDEDNVVRWTGPGNYISTDTVNAIQTSGVYYVSVTGGNGCVALDSVELVADTLKPLIVIAPAIPLKCERTSVQLNGSGSSAGGSYLVQWSTTTGSIEEGAESLTPLVTSEGMYTMVIENEENGCIAMDSIEVIREDSDLFFMQFSTMDETCLGSEDGMLIVDEIDEPPAVFQSSVDGGPFLEGDTIINLNPGEHLLTIRDSFGCTLDTIFQIQSGPVFDIQLEDQYTVKFGDSLMITPNIQNDIGDPADIQWIIQGAPFQQDGHSVLIIPEQDISIAVAGNTPSGCSAFAESVVLLEFSEDFYVPNVFSPQSETGNNLFRIYPGSSIVTIEDFRVFDRWGNLVYVRENISAEDQDFGWDGRFQGEFLQPAVYVYIAKFLLFNGEKREIKGTVTLLR